MFLVSRPPLWQTVAALALTAICTTGDPGRATSPGGADEDDTRTIIVPTDTLDLTSAAGQAALLRRVDAASRNVCGTFDVRDRRDTADYEACRARSRQGALAQVRRLVAQAGGDAFDFAAAVGTSR